MRLAYAHTVRRQRPAKRRVKESLKCCMPNGRKNDWSKTSVSAVVTVVVSKRIRLPISLRPHQKTRELGAIQSIAICKSTAPQWRFRAIWPKWTHPTGGITIRDAPKLVSNFPGPGSIVLPWPPQVYNNEMLLTPPTFATYGVGLIC